MYQNWRPSAEKTSARGCESEAGSPSRDSKNAIAWPAPRCHQRARCLSASSHSPAQRQVRCAVASGKKRWVTVDAQVIPSIKSGFFCAPRVIGSRSVNKNDSVRPSRQMRHTISVDVAYHCAQHVRDVFHQATPAQGRRPAARLIERLPTCPIPESTRPGPTLRKWKDAHVAYFDTAGASNAPHRSHQRTLSNEADAPPEATATPPTTNSKCSSSQDA